MKCKDLAKDGILLSPTGGGEEKVEIGGDGDDGDLNEIENARPVVGGRGVVRVGQEKQEDGRGPNKEKNVGGPRRLGGVGKKALVIGGDGLSAGLQGEGDGEEGPYLSKVSGGTKGATDADTGSQSDHGEIQGIREKKIQRRGRNESKVEKERENDEDDKYEKDAGKLTRREQETSQVKTKLAGGPIC